MKYKNRISFIYAILLYRLKNSKELEIIIEYFHVFEIFFYKAVAVDHCLRLLVFLVPLHVDGLGIGSDLRVGLLRGRRANFEAFLGRLLLDLILRRVLSRCAINVHLLDLLPVELGGDNSGEG